jgi:glycosyltransferase involved in cell wall biosynthesis
MGIDALTVPATEVGADDAPSLTRIMLLLWHGREDLRRAFDLTTPDGRRGLAAWYIACCVRRPDASAGGLRRLPWYGAAMIAGSAASRAGRRAPAPLRRFGKRSHQDLLVWAARRAARSAAGALSVPAAPPLATRRMLGLPGVNLIGHVRSESGLGQHLRHAAGALRAAGVPFCMVDHHVGTPSRRAAPPPPGAVADGNPHRTNVFLMSPDSVLTAYCRFGQAFFEGRRNILCAIWELARWPAAWVGLLDLFDEVWAPSEFTRLAAQAVRPDPVRRMPDALDMPAPAGLGREDFGLPRDAIVFLVVVDGFSHLERKNPVGAIRAFRRAFPSPADAVCLVVKTINLPRGSAGRRALAEAIDGDARVIVLERSLSYAEMVALYLAVDCLVSLHRAEGLGLCLAEAMWLGRPVIATAYSGVLDFAAPETACLVRHEFIDVRPGDYPHAGGQRWADPDLEEAGRWMRRVARRPAWAAALAKRGQERVREQFDPEAGGRRWIELLEVAGTGGRDTAQGSAPALD